MTFVLITLGTSVAIVLVISIILYITDIIEDARLNKFKNIPDIAKQYQTLDIVYSRFTAISSACAELRTKADELREQIAYLPRDQRYKVEEELDECLVGYQSLLDAKLKITEELDNLRHNLDEMYNDWRSDNGYRREYKY